MNIADLRNEIVADDAKAAFDTLVAAFASQADFSIAAHEQGYLNSLRIKRGEEFCFAVVPDEHWVLAYIRKPELRRGKITPDAVIAAFPAARLTSKGEITLRIEDASTAVRWLRLIQDEMG